MGECQIVIHMIDLARSMASPVKVNHLGCQGVHTCTCVYVVLERGEEKKKERVCMLHSDVLAYMYLRI